MADEIMGAGLRDRPDVERMTPLGGRIAAADAACEKAQEAADASVPAWPGLAIPAGCLRAVSSPPARERYGCAVTGGRYCAGLQRDGSCLAEMVVAANAAQVRWAFEVDPREGFWDYVGEPIPGYVPHTGPPVPPAADTEFDFVCPHCLTAARVPLGYYWCAACGLNANDPTPEDDETVARLAPIRQRNEEAEAEVAVESVVYPVVVEIAGGVPLGVDARLGRAANREELDAILAWADERHIEAVNLIQEETG